jgi:hypothetical protein
LVEQQGCGQAQQNRYNRTGKREYDTGQKRPHIGQTVVFEGEIIENRRVIVESYKRGAKDAIQITKPYITKANPNAEKSREQDQAKDDNGRGRNEQVCQADLAGMHRATEYPPKQ